MFEICFNESVKGALKIAQHCGDNQIIGLIGVVFIAKRKNKLLSFSEKKIALQEFKREQKVLQRQAISLNGNPKDVLGLSLYLSEGDIASPIVFEQCPRKEFLFSLLTVNPDDALENTEKLRFWQEVIDDLERLKQGIDKVRIWIDNTPDATCGLLFVADLLINTDTEIYIVSLPPKYQISDNCYVEYSNWGSVPAELFGTFLCYEKILSKDEVLKLSLEWKQLQMENAPLRVVETDKVISATESYYDDFIRSEFPKESCTIAMLIGNLLSSQKIPTEDAFIAKRIKNFIQNGELEIVNSNQNEFRNIIKTVK